MAKGKLVSSTGIESEISFDRLVLSQSLKIQAAAKWISIFVSLAVASVFVPILHFILVPAFLIAAVVVGVKAYTQKADLQNISGNCPNCGAALLIKRVRIKKVSGEICPQCRDFLKIHSEG